jgi:hypothetical protein
VSHRQPVRVPERHQFDALIDARSPAEFALDHIPGSINCPVLSNAERYLESFNGPALFGDDSGSIRKLPGVATRKTMRLDATTTNLSVGADHLNGLGNALNNRIIGNDQDNILDGLSGADTMIGGKGNDSYYVDNAGDRVIEQADQGIDTVYSTVSTRLSAGLVPDSTQLSSWASRSTRPGMP